MRPARVLSPVIGLLFAAAAISPLLAQMASPGATPSPTAIAPVGGRSSSASGSGGVSTTSSRVPTPTRALRQILPDPALLDGSKLAPDKYPDYGMIGDFDLPGDDVTDPAANQRVGASNPNQTEPAAGGSSPPDPNQKNSGGSAAQEKSEPAGNASSQGQPGGAAGSSGSGAGGNTAGAKPGGQSPGGSDPNAKADGVQVGNLVVDESAANSPQIAVTGAPVEIGLGDTAMAIKPVASAAGATGTQSAGSTQQSGMNTGGGSQPSGGSGGGGGNRGSERGKTMQSGL